MPRNTKMLSAGEKLSHYQIISAIGAGRMGEVYLAEDTRLDRQVAIKFLNEAFSRDSEKLSRFVREAKAASALNHPNILTVYEIGNLRLQPQRTVLRPVARREPSRVVTFAYPKPTVATLQVPWSRGNHSRNGMFSPVDQVSPGIYHRPHFSNFLQGNASINCNT